MLPWAEKPTRPCSHQPFKSPHLTESIPIFSNLLSQPIHRPFIKMVERRVAKNIPSISIQLLARLSLREREKEFYLTPDKPGCGHKAADTAEPSERSESLCLLGRSMYRSRWPFYLYYKNYIVKAEFQVYLYLWQRAWNDDMHILPFNSASEGGFRIGTNRALRNLGATQPFTWKGKAS